MFEVFLWSVPSLHFAVCIITLHPLSCVGSNHCEKCIVLHTIIYTVHIKYLALIAMWDQVTPDILLAINQTCKYPSARSVALVVKQKIWLQNDSLVLCCSSGLKHLYGHTSACKPLTYFLLWKWDAICCTKAHHTVELPLSKAVFLQFFFFPKLITFWKGAFSAFFRFLHNFFSPSHSECAEKLWSGNTETGAPQNHWNKRKEPHTVRQFGGFVKSKRWTYQNLPPCYKYILPVSYSKDCLSWNY